MRSVLQRALAAASDGVMCAMMNAVQARNARHASPPEEFEDYIRRCEEYSPAEYYAVPGGVPAVRLTAGHERVMWNSPRPSGFAANDVARVELFPCKAGWNAPTVLMLHALMSASDAGYRRWAAAFNLRGWNACFVHLPYHYSRKPPGYLNGELAITSNLIRTGEGIRQAVVELRQLMAALRLAGSREFGLWAVSYGGWVGALLAAMEEDFRFAALITPILDVEHAIWRSPVAATLRRQLAQRGISPDHVARHYFLSCPSRHRPLCDPTSIVIGIGHNDSISRAADLREVGRGWGVTDYVTSGQGHFGYRLMQKVFLRLDERGLI